MKVSGRSQRGGENRLHPRRQEAILFLGYPRDRPPLSQSPGGCLLPSSSSPSSPTPPSALFLLSSLCTLPSSPPSPLFPPLLPLLSSLLSSLCSLPSSPPSPLFPPLLPLLSSLLSSFFSPPASSTCLQDPDSAEAAAWACTEGGRWVAAPFEGGGIQDGAEETYTCQFRPPSSGIIYTPPQYSDHIGVSLLLALGGEGGRKEEEGKEEERWKNGQRSVRETQPHKTQRKLKDFFGGGCGKVEVKDRDDGSQGEEERGEGIKRKVEEPEQHEGVSKPAVKLAKMTEEEEGATEGKQEARASTKLCVSEKRMQELIMSGGGRDRPEKGGRRKESERGKGNQQASHNIMNFFVKKS
eukprot:764810-Hanusia_phi.AAC.2